MDVFYLVLFKIYSLYLSLKKRFLKKYQSYRYKTNLDINPSACISNEAILTFATSEAKAFIAEGVEIRPFSSLYVFEDGQLVIGKNVFINSYCSINCACYIEIGENTLIGESVRMYDHNHVYTNDEGLKVSPHGFTKKKVLIGKDCWIGTNVTILKGVDIGDNVIIGANNFIYKSIPSNSIVKSNQSYTVQTF